MSLGLNVEQRKRLTIGVELAAKPQLLLFLDEPTSGLDGQTSWAILALLEKLTAHGQAVLCTIHQPSATLFERFDRLLFLAAGGKPVYFGDIGPSCTLTAYFEKNGAKPYPPDANPAEWMMEVIGAAPGTIREIDLATSLAPKSRARWSALGTRPHESNPLPNVLRKSILYQLIHLPLLRRPVCHPTEIVSPTNLHPILSQPNIHLLETPLHPERPLHRPLLPFQLQHPAGSAKPNARHLHAHDHLRQHRPADLPKLRRTALALRGARTQIENLLLARLPPLQHTRRAAME